MKRDFELIRELLLYIERVFNGTPMLIENFYGYPNAKVKYHCQLLIDKKLILGEVKSDLLGRATCLCNGLSWEGQDYLANIKNDDVWNQVKKTAMEKGVDLTIEIISTIAAKYTKKLLLD